MNPARFPFTAIGFFSLFLFLGVACDPVFAQKPPPPPKPNPQAPTLASVAPSGMQRGTKLELTLNGTNLAGPTSLWTSFPANVTIPTEGNNGKDNARLRVVLEVPRDAPLGFHGIRLATTRGMSNLRLFCLDDLPQVLEANNNHAKNTAQAVTAPCVVVGRADKEVSDYFKIAVQAGQRLSFEILGRRLGSAFDPQITLYHAATGRELPGGYSNDTPGLQTDARLTYTFKEAGEYLLEVRDATYAGGADYDYRLRIGDFPCATTPYPLAIKRGTKAASGFAGPMVEGVAAVEVSAPSDTLIGHVWVSPRGGNGLHGWPVLLGVSELAQTAEQEPNNDPAKATRLTIPCGVSGRFLEKGDIDHYVFPAKKGERWIIEAKTFEMFSPAEVYLVLKDAKGAQVSASNPAAAPRLDFTAPTDGDFALSAEHLHYWGGPSETYHLSIEPYEPAFELSIALDRWDAPQGGTVALPILAKRLDYKGPIEVSVVGHPGLKGQVTIAANQPAKPTDVAATLTITVGPDVPVGPIVFAIQGKATMGKPVVRYVSVGSLLTQALANLPYPPPELEWLLGLAVKPPAPKKK